MRHHLWFCLLVLPLIGVAQQHPGNGATHLAKVNAQDPSLPRWAQLMYADDPDVNAVQDAYAAWFSEHPFEKTVHTQYYMLWLNSVRERTGPDGRIQHENPQEREERTRKILHARSGERDNGWTFCGPDVQRASDGSLTEVSEQANVYCHDRALTDPDLLYCGTECGGLYKTTDAGAHWSFVTANYLVGAVSAVRIDPENPQIVIFSGEDDLWRTTDGGATWQVIGDAAFQALDISAWEIAFDPSDANTVLAACNEGMFRSTDGGDNWTEVLPENCETIAYKPDDPATVYTIEFEPTLNYSKFYKSTDHGATWAMNDNGWYAPPVGEAGLYEITGGRIAVSAADPNRIYGLLVGYQQAGASITTNGWIGIWRSDDAGATWTFPHDSIGTPYTPTHPNLMNFSGDDGTYSQIHYNTTMVVSQLDADHVLIGGMDLWQSTDGCATYAPLGGYIGSLPYLHVDMQELRIYKTGPVSEEVWLSSDGGIQHSDDLFQSFQARNRGIHASNLWGYDQGWNDDIRVGGRYHNGDMGFSENYPENEYLALGGGEAATGYVKYTDERKAFFSDIDGKVIPESMDQVPENFGMDLDPNESYYDCNSSRILFDNGYYNVAWSGKNNTLMRSVNGATAFGPFHTFGTNTANNVLWIDQPYLHPEVLYVQQAITNGSRIWRTTDGGTTWTQMSLPSTSRNLYFTAGAGPDELWVAYQDRPNGQKVYHTTDGGSNWQNMTTPLLDGARITAIAHQLGTDGGVYIALRTGSVYYRDNTMSDWENWSDGLPVDADPLRIVPFYKGGKVRFAAWNLAVWERDLHSPSAVQANFATEYGTFFCPGDSVHFVDHSVATASATYLWNFPGATPSSSTEKFPTVVYDSEGTHDVTLAVTDGGQTSTITKPAYIGSASTDPLPLIEGFESGSIPENWHYAHPTGGSTDWSTDTVGGYANSSHCMRFDNFNNDTHGGRDEVWTNKHDLSTAINTYVKFDVAYAEYGGQYSDTLAVLATSDCGLAWSTLYVKGGSDLATTPQDQDQFTPDGSQWRTDSVSLGDFDGDPTVIIAFQNRGHYGNVIYVDNINITTPAILAAVEEQEGGLSLSVFPNPASDVLNIAGSGSLRGAVELVVLDAAGREVERSQTQGSSHGLRASLSVATLGAGEYTLLLRCSTGNRSARFSVLPR